MRLFLPVLSLFAATVFYAGGAMAQSATCESYSQQSNCVSAGCMWENNMCKEMGNGSPPACNMYTKKEQCEAASCAWNESASTCSEAASGPGGPSTSGGGTTNGGGAGSSPISGLCSGGYTCNGKTLDWDQLKGGGTYQPQAPTGASYNGTQNYAVGAKGAECTGSREECNKGTVSTFTGENGGTLVREENPKPNKYNSDSTSPGSHMAGALACPTGGCYYNKLDGFKTGLSTSGFDGKGNFYATSGGGTSGGTTSAGGGPPATTR